MRKSQIIKRQVNLKNENEFVVCPYGKIAKQRPLFSCHINCDRYAGIDDGFVLCGRHGLNETLPERSHPSLREVLRSWGDDDRGCI